MAPLLADIPWLPAADARDAARLVDLPALFPPRA